MLVEMEKELILSREENGRLKTLGEGRERRIKDLEERLVNAEAANASLARKLEAFNTAAVKLGNELDEKELMLNQQKKVIIDSGLFFTAPQGLSRNALASFLLLLLLVMFRF